MLYPNIPKAKDSTKTAEFQKDIAGKAVFMKIITKSKNGVVKCLQKTPSYLIAGLVEFR